MIHMVDCNGRDCPWYRRGSKCKHPLAENENVAVRSDKGAPLGCPLRKEPDVVMAAPLAGDDKIDLDKIDEMVRRQLSVWSELRRVARRTLLRKKKNKERN
jgi:hypothetical protein